MKEQLYFSTAVDLSIDGVTYRPSICYPMPPLAKAALDKWAEKGKVKFYSKPVRFVNGISFEVPEKVDVVKEEVPVMKEMKKVRKSKSRKKGAEDWQSTVKF